MDTVGLGSNVAVADGLVFVGTSTQLVALDSATGSTVWTDPYSAGADSPTVEAGVVYVPSSYGLSALDAATGTLMWHAGISGLDFGTPAVGGGNVYAVGTVNGFASVYAFRASDGAHRWTTLWGVFEGTNTPSFAGGFVYVGFNNVVEAYDSATGAHLWTSRPLVGIIEENPVAAHGLVYVGTRLSPGFYGLDGTTGATVWSTTTVGSQDPAAVAGGVVYVHDWNLDSTFEALDASTGSVLYTALLHDAPGSGPVVADGRVYVNSGGTRVRSFGLTELRP